MSLKKQRGEATEETKDGVHSSPESDLRKWEDLDQDCLVRILRKVGMKSLITCVPFVCKSWYKASLLPDCWVKISFDECLLGSDVELNAKLVKFVVNRSAGATQFLQLPVNCGSMAWDYISDGCPALKRLCFMVPKYDQRIPELICKWKYLEVLFMCVGHLFKEILSQINIHCKKFRTLAVLGKIHHDEASAIANFLPNIKCLIIKGSIRDRESLKVILIGCRKLKILNVSDSLSFKVDNEMLKMASHIKAFSYEGEPVFSESDGDDDDDDDWLGEEEEEEEEEEEVEEEEEEEEEDDDEEEDEEEEEEEEEEEILLLFSNVI